MFPLADTNRAHSAPLVTWALIAINLIIFFVEMSLGSPYELRLFFRHFGFIPEMLVHDPSPHVLASLVTNLFLHSGWVHLLGNMWFLHIFGDNVEDRMGHLGFFCFYLICGVVANIAQLFADPYCTQPVVGASGAIAGVIGAYLFLFPYAKVNTLILFGIIPFFVRVPAIFYTLLWFFLNWVSAVFTPRTAHGAEQVAWWAHLGGFAVGFILVRFFEAPRREETRFYPDQYYPW